MSRNSSVKVRCPRCDSLALLVPKSFKDLIYCNKCGCKIRPG